MPKDSRLLRLVNSIVANPSRQFPADASRAGVSKRTLRRLFENDIGMSFARWRQQLHVCLAINQLEKGRPVKAITFDLGYGSPSAFIAMFRKNTGFTPGRFPMNA